MKRNVVFILLLCILAACSQTREEQTAVTILATGTATVAPLQTATNVATKLPTKLPIATATLGPTQSAATAVPTHTPTVTNTPMPAEIEVDGFQMVYIPEGAFSMGAESETLLESCEQFRDKCNIAWFESANPIHEVWVDAFYIDSFEVTNSQFVQFLNEIGSHEQSCAEEACWVSFDSRIIRVGLGVYEIRAAEADYPVTGVTWYGAASFCDWRDARLPTEAEWEKAASWDARSQTKYQYAWGDTFNGLLTNHCDGSCWEAQSNTDVDDGYGQEAPVGSFENGRSPMGAYDMSGNVWEWVGDWYDTKYYADSQENNPGGPTKGENRIVRGGSWFDSGNFTATTIRFPAPPDESSNTIGFRCVLNH